MNLLKLAMKSMILSRYGEARPSSPQIHPSQAALKKFQAAIYLGDDARLLRLKAPASCHSLRALVRGV